MVATVLETYARATNYLHGLTDLDEISIAQAFLEDRIHWYRFKKLLRHVEELLNNGIVVIDEKIYDRWLKCQRSLDTQDEEAQD